MIQPIEVAAKCGPLIGGLGGAFMRDEATTARRAALGLDLAGLHGLGRGAVLGDASVEAVAAAFPFIPAEVVHAVWSHARSVLDPGAARTTYAEACRELGSPQAGRRGRTRGARGARCAARSGRRRHHRGASARVG